MASPRPDGTKRGGGSGARSQGARIRAPVVPRAANDNAAAAGGRQPRWLLPLLAALGIAVALLAAIF